MDVATIIKERRIELGLTQKEVAVAVGVSEATVSRWEAGEIENMRRDRIFNLARVLRVRPSVLITGDLDTANSVDEISEKDSLIDYTLAEIRRLTPENRAKLVDYLKLLLQSQQSD